MKTFIFILFISLSAGRATGKVVFDKRGKVHFCKLSVSVNFAVDGCYRWFAEPKLTLQDAHGIFPNKKLFADTYHRRSRLLYKKVEVTGKLRRFFGKPQVIMAGRREQHVELPFQGDSVPGSTALEKKGDKKKREGLYLFTEEEKDNEINTRQTIKRNNGRKVRGSVWGTLIDAEMQQPLSEATVSVSSEKESWLQPFTTSSDSGYFRIKDLDTGKYTLTASYQGLQTIRVPFSITAEKLEIDLGRLTMVRLYKVLDAVVVGSEPAIRVKGDTLLYRADSFKVRPNATVEDLLKKLPGVQVDQDGNVKTSGEDVQRVYVDGKEFFTNDPRMATKNLSADMVDQVQVFNDAGEQAKFTGIDDGSRTKAINLKLKKDKNKGLFGKVYAGYGSQQRFESGFNVNYFNKNSQTSLIYKGNNINDNTFSNAGRSSSAGGSRRAGLVDSYLAGANYRGDWGKASEVNGSYFYNTTRVNNETRSFRQRFFEDSTIATARFSSTGFQNDNHRLNLNLTFTIDSMNTITYAPNVFKQRGYNSNSETLTDSVFVKGTRYKLSDYQNEVTNTTMGQNISNNLSWRKRFYKQGRSLYTSLYTSGHTSDGTSFLINNARFYNTAGVEYRQRNTDYRLNTNSKGNAFGATMSYTEPLSNSVFLEMNYSYSSNRSNADRKTFQYDTLAKAYHNVIDSLTNLFEYTSVIHTGGANFRGVGKKYNYQVGLSVQQSVLENTDLSKSLFTRQHNRNLFSTASLYYQPTRTKNLRIGYRGNTVQPTSFQLQNVRDVTRYPYIYTGNPALRQEFVHNVQFSYNSFNTATFRNMSVSLHYNQTFDKIVNSLEQRPGGEQLAMPVNIDGVYSVSGNINYSVPIRQRSSRNISINTGLDYNRDATVLNGKKNYADQLALNADVVLNYAVNDYLDFSLGAAAAYNKIKYTLQDFAGDSYLSQNYNASISWQFLNGFTMATDAAFNIYSGRTALYNQDYLLWNTMLSRSVFKNRNGELRLRVIDMLNNNIYLTRNIADNSIEDIQALALRRFGMLSFIYNLRRNTARKD